MASYVIFSAEEAAADADIGKPRGFWSNTDGWTVLQDATVFGDTSGNLPYPEDAQWVRLPVARKAARTTKAGLVLSDGCKVKIDPNVNPDATDPAHIADLESFHAEIHALQAARRAAFLARPAGDGLIDGTAYGIGRVTPRAMVDGYVLAQQATYKNAAERQKAQLPWAMGEFLRVPLMVTKDADGNPVYEQYTSGIRPSEFRPIGAEAALAAIDKAQRAYVSA